MAILRPYNGVSKEVIEQMVGDYLEDVGIGDIVDEKLQPVIDGLDDKIEDIIDPFKQQVEDDLDNKSDVGHTHSEYVEKVTGKELSDNNFSDTDKNKLDGLTNYTLPIAANNTLGGIKIGTGLSIDADGVVSASGGGVAGSVDWADVNNKPTTFPPSDHNHDTLYYQKTDVDTKLSDKAEKVHSHSEYVEKVVGKELSTNDFSDTDKNKLDGLTNYTLPIAANNTLGGIKIGTGLAIDSSGVVSATGGGVASSVDWNNVINKPSVFAPDVHNHNDLYYQKSESDSALSNKAEKVHTHSNYVEKVVGKELSTNDFTDNDKTKLDALINYTLPTASASVLGGIKVGSGLAIDGNGIVSTEGTTFTGTVDWDDVTDKPSVFAPDVHNHNDLYNTKAEMSSALSNKSDVGHIHNEYVEKVSGKELSDNNFSDVDKTKLDGLTNYTLPIATDTVMGGIKVGGGLTITSNGILSATGGGVADSVEWNNVVNKPTTFPPSTHNHDDLYNTKAEITNALATKSDTTHTHSNYVEKVSGKELSTNDFTDNDKTKLDGLMNYTLPIAANNTLGGIKIGTGLAIDGNGIVSTEGTTFTGTVDWDDVTNKPTTFAPDVHNHNDLYYQKSESDSALALKSDVGHTHSEYSLTTHTHTNYVEKVSGKELSTNDFTDADKSKLDGISAGANAYVLPTASSNVLGGIKVGSGLSIDVNGIVTVNSGEVATWDNLTGKPTTFPPSTHNHNDLYNTKAEITNALTNKADVGHTHSEYSLTGHTHTNYVEKVSGKELSDNNFSDDDKIKLNALINYTLPTATASTLGGIKIGNGLSISNGVVSITGGTVTWDNLTGKPSAFPPSDHNHDTLYYKKTDVDGKVSNMQTQIDDLVTAVTAIIQTDINEINTMLG